jgi:hypothetical protein
MKTINYDISKFNFPKIVGEYLQCDDLSLIHESKDFSYFSKFKRENDQSTHYHKKFYTLARTDKFLELYNTFIEEVVKKEYGCNIVYQKIPTFRMQFPNNIAVGEYHRDRDYRNGEWASKVQEMNFFLPITKAYNSNTIWVESEEGKEDFAPMNCDPGQIIMWDGSNLLHGNKENIEPHTRVSMDFRVIKKANYIPSDKGSINTNTKFCIGGYYSEV